MHSCTIRKLRIEELSAAVLVFAELSTELAGTIRDSTPAECEALRSFVEVARQNATRAEETLKGHERVHG